MIDKFVQFLEDENAPAMYITGVAGTGKTTSLAKLISYCIENRITTVTCAYTHKAVGVLRSKLPKDTNNNVTCTLHKFLKKRPTINDAALKLKEVEGNTQVSIPQQVQVLFVDEFSMIGERDYVDIVDVQYDEDANLITKVVYIGDPNQLPPVKDLQTIQPRGKYCIELTEIYRQSGDNPLIDTLMQLNDIINGEEARPLTEHSNFIRETDIIEGYKKCKTSKVILAYTNACVEEINAKIQDRYIPLVGDELFSPTLRTLYTLDAIDNDCDHVLSIRGELMEKDSKYKTLETLHAIDKVQFFVLTDTNMHTVQRAVVFGHNTYLLKQQELAKKAVHINKQIEDKYGVEAKVWARNNWQEELAKKRSKAWREYLTFKDCVICIDFKHAMTIHKSQGSTYENVYLDMNDIGKCADNDYLLYLKLLYVAISRASDTVYTN